MKTVKKNVYYCDHCKKRSLSAGHMRGHETHCTANINRECKICIHNSRVSHNIKEIVDGYKERFVIEDNNFTTLDDWQSYSAEVVKWIGEPITLDDVREKVDNCPNCILAIMRQCKFHYACFSEFGFQDFDYKKELATEVISWKRDYADYD